MSAATINTADESAALFQPFEWVTRAFQTGAYDLVANARDLAGGTCVIMEMIEQSELNVENGDVPIFNDYNRGRLFRMAVAAVHTIELQTAAHLEKMQQTGEAQSERAARTGSSR